VPTETGIAYDAPQFFLGCAVGYASRADYILFQHHRPHVVAAKRKPIWQTFNPWVTQLD